MPGMVLSPQKLGRWQGCHEFMTSFQHFISRLLVQMMPIPWTSWERKWAVKDYGESLSTDRFRGLENPWLRSHGYIFPNKHQVHLLSHSTHSLTLLLDIYFPLMVIWVQVLTSLIVTQKISASNRCHKLNKYR